MFNDKQKRLFNQGYGAYRQLLGFCTENSKLLENDMDASKQAAIVIMSDLQLQKILLSISSFPAYDISEAEQTYISSIVESANLLKKVIPGYGKFIRCMKAENYSLISDELEKSIGEVPISLLLATKVNEEIKIKSISMVIDNFKTIFNSYIALSDNNEETQNSIAISFLSKYEDYAMKQGINIKGVFTQASKLTQKKSTKGEAKLNSLIGLAKVKREVIEMLNILKVNELRKSEGLEPINVSKHMVFTGNPGTGKTTVARLIAQIYKENGIVTKGQLIETDRSGLVDTIVGGTAQKVKNVVESAIGGVLFIDEAYSLTPKGGGNDFGQEAVATLVKLMEDNKDDLVVIVAGYKKEMQNFIDSNPGLKSRFKRYIEFEDYSANQMQEIFEIMAEKDGYILSSGVKERLINIWNITQQDSSFGNGRGVRNVYEQVLAKQASRIINTNEKSKIPIITILACDIPDSSIYKFTSVKKNTIGFVT